MNEKHNTVNISRQDIIQLIISFFAGATTLGFIVLGAEKMGYARINFGKQSAIPYEQLKDFAKEAGIDIIKYCQENIDAKDIAKFLEKIAPKL